MEERFIAFTIWGIIGLLFIVMGIYEFHSKKAKPFGFWANAEVAPIEDVKGYNRALGILWCVYGVLFTLNPNTAKRNRWNFSVMHNAESTLKNRTLSD